MQVPLISINAMLRFNNEDHRQRFDVGLLPASA
jgi:hypothetical protein